MDRSDLPRSMLQVLAIGLLILSTLWIVWPFLAATTWAATIVVATWPVLIRVQNIFGGRRGLAVATMTIALLLLLIVPLAYGIDAIVRHSDNVVEWSRQLSTFEIPKLPAWVASLPLVGRRIETHWRQFSAMTPDQMAAALTPYAQVFALWIARKAGGVGMLVLSFLLTVIVCAILYANGEAAAHGVRRFAHRLAGEQGVQAVDLAGQAVRGVALGVIVTATLQTLLVGLGLFVAQVPLASVLVGVTFVLCIAQLGPILVLIPVTIWLYWSSGPTWGTGFLVWSLICGLMDNFVRPVLIRRGADLPLLLIFTGVIGGLLAMGVIGLFVGPVVLAVAYTVLADWMDQDEGEPV